MEPTYRVVFRGELLPGFELSSVKQAAEVRLKAPAAILTQLFSGRRVILKKGIALEIGNRYVAELENLGMKACVEAETPPQTNSISAELNNSRPEISTSALETVPKLVLPNLARAVEVTPDAQIVDTLSQDLGAYAPPTEAAGFGARPAPTEATVFAPHNDRQTVFTSATTEQTVFVPRHASSEPTMLVETASAAQHYPPAEPTVFVPRSTNATTVPSTSSYDNLTPPAEATVFVPRQSGNDSKRGFDSERTLIASAETLAEYFSATTPSRTPDDPSLLEDSGATAAKPEPESRNYKGSNDKTVLADTPPAYRPGSNDTTIFVAPRRDSSEPTIMSPLGGSDELRQSLIDEFGQQNDDQTGSTHSNKNSRLVVILVVLAAAAAAYYYFAMQ